VAPILATGLYHVSRACNSGRCVGMPEVIALWRSGDGRLVRFGLLLGLAGTGWVLTSAGLITLWSPEPIHKPIDFLRHVVLVRDIGLFEAWLLLGALLAAPVFASSVVAIPMLVDTIGPRQHGGGRELACRGQSPGTHGILGCADRAVGGRGHVHRAVGLGCGHSADCPCQLARLLRPHDETRFSA
jgi:hypothetical protein